MNFMDCYDSFEVIGYVILCSTGKTDIGDLSFKSVTYVFHSVNAFRFIIYVPTAN